MCRLAGVGAEDDCPYTCTHGEKVGMCCTTLLLTWKTVLLNTVALYGRKSFLILVFGLRAPHSSGSSMGKQAGRAVRHQQWRLGSVRFHQRSNGSSAFKCISFVLRLGGHRGQPPLPPSNPFPILLIAQLFLRVVALSLECMGVDGN